MSVFKLHLALKVSFILNDSPCSRFVIFLSPVLHAAMLTDVVALVPEAPTNLQVSAESTTSIRVTWDSPPETNGPIVTYKVCSPMHCRYYYYYYKMIKVS